VLVSVPAAYLLLGQVEVRLAQVCLVPHGLQCHGGACARFLSLLLLPPLHVRQQPAQSTTGGRKTTKISTT
jgi:hypothetical protein